LAICSICDLIVNGERRFIGVNPIIDSVFDIIAADVTAVAAAGIVMINGLVGGIVTAN